MTAAEAEAVARQAVDSPAMDGPARVRPVCRGVLYGLIGALAVQIAFGNDGREARRAGSVVDRLGLAGYLARGRFAGYGFGEARWRRT
ncbi:DUF1206 domain-containing protein [Nonomuraea polychroma]|uniref:DUF1206 domain-containing protein n=1 Tax=Nonomuraea polychroma TaxID=46176 RepID=UPI003D8B7E99